MLRKIRIILGSLSILAVTALFLDFSGTLSPILGWLPKVQLVPAILACSWIAVAAIIVITLLLGRVYCSVVCPLGIMQDVVNRLRSWVGPRKSRKNRFHYTRPLTALRTVIFLLFTALIVTGFTAVAALIEPYSEYGRIVTELIRPIFIEANNMIAAHSPEDAYTFYEVASPMVSVMMTLIAALTLLTVGIMAWMGGRIYCNSICPVGTLLGYLGRHSLFKPVIDTEKCISCGKCARRCKASCIDARNHLIDYTRCVDCMDCIGNCSTGAISYTRKPYRAKGIVNKETVDSRRRSFVVMATALAGAAAVKAAEKTTDGGLAPITPKSAPGRTTSLVPPGALSIANVRQHCTACQLCISKCPNNVLRPRIALDGMMQPEMSYEHGYCRPECTACSDACPTGAIRPISKAAKSSVQIGHAVVNHDDCIAAKGEAACGNCYRHCPTGAIQMIAVKNDGPKVPIVNEAICIGCGACEHLCPVSPVSAIIVEGHEQHRYL